MASDAFNDLATAAAAQFRGIYSQAGLDAREAELLAYAANLGIPQDVAQQAINAALGRGFTEPDNASKFINQAVENEKAIANTLTKLGDNNITAGEMLAFSDPTALQVAKNTVSARNDPNITTEDLRNYGNGLTLPEDVIDYLVGSDSTLDTPAGVVSYAAGQATMQEQGLQQALSKLGVDPTTLTPNQLAAAANTFAYDPTGLTNFTPPEPSKVTTKVNNKVVTTTQVPIGGKLYTTAPVKSAAEQGFKGLSGLSKTISSGTTAPEELSTTTAERVDFSKLPAQLRTAGQYADMLVMPTKGPSLSTYQQVLGGTKTGSAGAMPTYTMGRAPTPEEAFRNFIYAGDADDTLASQRILEYARNRGLTPEQTVSLANNALRGQRVGFPDFTLTDYDAAVAKGKGLLAIPEARKAPALSYTSPGFTAPSQGGLAAARAQGMDPKTYYGNIAAALDLGLGPQDVAGAMKDYGITADDLIAARAMFPSASTVTTTGQGTTATDIPGTKQDEVVVGREGGPIAFVDGGDVMAGEKAYTLADFGITPVTLETARAQKIFETPRNVLFGPELKGLEAVRLAQMTPEDNVGAYQGLLARQRRNFAEGGGVGRGLGSIAMKGYAQEMAQKGRFGDTMLAHISPEEAQMLQAAGGAGTINPQTGLPEYFSWKKLLKGVGKVLPFVLPFTGIGLGAQALISGLSGAVSGGKGFDFKRGLMSGLMSYGMGSLAQGAGAAANAPTPDITVPQIDTSMNPAFADQAANVVGSGAAPAVNTFKSIADVPLTQMPGQFLENIQAVGQGAMGSATGAPGAREAFTAGQGSVFGKQVTPTMAAGAAAVGMGGVKAADEMNQFELQQAMANARTEEDRERFRQLFLRTLGSVGFAGGGDIAAMVAGGATGPANEPRTINGAGDGMSDSVPATIEGVQEARLADGEFVIPADVVADLGNGSSNAGSKKLYAMMDRVRKARHGTTRQPPEVDTGRLMPA